MKRILKVLTVVCFCSLAIVVFANPGGVGAICLNSSDCTTGLMCWRFNPSDQMGVCVRFTTNQHARNEYCSIWKSREGCKTMDNQVCYNDVWC